MDEVVNSLILYVCLTLNFLLVIFFLLTIESPDSGEGL